MGEVTTSSKDAIRNEADRLNDEAVRLQGQTRFDRAREAFTRAAALYQQIGDKAGEARCLNGVGATSKDLEEFSEARRWLEAALPLRQEVGDRRGEALTLLTLGPVYKALGLSEQAEKVLEIALHLAEKSGDRRLQGQVCFNLGSTNKASGNYEAALKWDEQALAIWGKRNRMTGEQKISESTLALESVDIVEFGRPPRVADRQFAAARRESSSDERLAPPRGVGPAAVLEIPKKRLAIKFDEDAPTVVRRNGAVEIIVCKAWQF